MTRKTIRTLTIFFIGLFVGFLIFFYIGSKTEDFTLKEDSLLVNSLYANSTIDEANQDINSTRQNSITRAVKVLSPAVVAINVTQIIEYQRNSPFSTRDPRLREFFPEFFKDYRYQQQFSSLGSGFIISSDGYILTNEHVVENANEITISMTDGQKAAAKIVGTDPKSDVALLKIDMESLQFAKLGNSDQIILGEWAIAVGNPFGLFDKGNKATVTVGVISALNRDFGEMEDRIYQDMIQTDASINQGNSGGPLCNALGEVIGMNTFIYSETQRGGSIGIGFAIPINKIARLIDDLKTNTRIDRDFWIGIRVKNLDPVIARKMGYDGSNGVIVTYIDRESPAEKSGMKLGDIVVKIGKTTVSMEKHVTDAIFEEDLRVGDDLTMQVWRDGNLLNLKLNLKSIKGY
jgi:serine protease Do